MNIIDDQLKRLIFIVCALLAFAGNSVLCRLALGEEKIDALSFTSVRLIAGIVMMLLIVIFRKKSSHQSMKSRQLLSQGSWLGAIMLFVYALLFSLAYVTLDTGIGALILFATVQLTMILVGVLSGQRISMVEIFGVLLAFSGFVYLVLPNLSTPSMLGFLLMTGSGVAWGVYTLLGRGTDDPISDTAANFVKTLPFVVVLLLFGLNGIVISSEGLWLAIVSGALTSGIGYTIWYVVLPHLSVTHAAVFQLLVPIIAAVGGVIFAAEQLTQRLLIASVLVLGGILVVIVARKRVTA